MNRDNHKNDRNGDGRVVYSTNPDFRVEADAPREPLTPDPTRQRLRVALDSRQRAGKTVTVISGFVGAAADLNDLARLLKGRCGVGGSVKDGDIIMQGDLKEKITTILRAAGYGVK
ncbi:MAG: translation initiation factor [Odoribacteraceae bacterium]|jgi:translation initiation factor 1|nr:translation initiation factor [Odoribacteraceae bacterium]